MTHTTAGFRHVLFSSLGLLAVAFPCPAAPPEAASSRFPASEGWKPLFNGKELEGWKLRNPGAKKVWVACDDVRLDPSNPGDSSRWVPAVAPARCCFVAATAGDPTS